MKKIKKPKRGTRNVLYFPDDRDGTIIQTGTGNIDLVCGKCGSILLKDMQIFGNIITGVYQCNNCKTYNEKPEFKCKQSE